MGVMPLPTIVAAYNIVDLIINSLSFLVLSFKAGYEHWFYDSVMKKVDGLDILHQSEAFIIN